MSRTRSGQLPVVMENDPTLHVTRRLMSCHVREGGENTPHACCICQTEMCIRSNALPSWMACPTCHEVFHETCLLAHVKRSDDDTFMCPTCRGTHRADSVEDAWFADDAIERLNAESDQDYLAPSCIEDEEVHSHEHNLRSHGKNTKCTIEVRRRLRSSTVY